MTATAPALITFFPACFLPCFILMQERGRGPVHQPGTATILQKAFRSGRRLAVSERMRREY